MPVSKKKQTPLPLELLTRFTRAADGLWKKVDLFRAALEEEISPWDRRVFIPYNSWYEFLRREFPRLADMGLMVYITQNLSALGAWRPTQDIIRFDPDLYAALVKTELTGNLPSDILQRLPAWGVYIEAPALEFSGRSYEGFFANLDLCNEPGLVLLSLHLLDAGLETSHVMLPLGEWSLGEAVEKTNDDFRRGAALSRQPVRESSLLRLESGLVQALNLLIYVCSHGLAEGGRWGVSAGGGAGAKKVRGVLRFFPPDKPRIRHMGGEFGDQIRKFERLSAAGASDGHARPRPHIRRAHWHGYWQGPIKRKDSEKPRQFSVRWLPPIPVGWLDDDGRENPE